MENLKVHNRIDLRPVLQTDKFKLDDTSPREATADEKKAFNIISSEPCYLYKHISVRREVTIVQFFTLTHAYLGGGEYKTLDTEHHALSEADINRIANVVQF